YSLASEPISTSQPLKQCWRGFRGDLTDASEPISTSQPLKLGVNAEAGERQAKLQSLSQQVSH
ncbi:hypothetical protein ACYT7O_10685, partial [Streptococcus pyogenes]